MIEPVVAKKTTERSDIVILVQTVIGRLGVPIL